MKSILTSTALAAVIAAGLALPAAAEEGCNVPQDQWQPEAALRQQLEGQGWAIQRIKVDDGCYEVYAKDQAGKRQEVYFDPRTLQPVAED